MKKKSVMLFEIPPIKTVPNQLLWTTGDKELQREVVRMLGDDG
jgi:hypothetical protein